MLEHGIPIEAIITELVLSGEVERTYRLLREGGYAAQSEHHSPTSQYGQLSRRGPLRPLDVAATMRELVDDIDVGRVRRRVGRRARRRLPEARRPCARRRPDPRSRRSNGSCARATRRGRPSLIAAVVERTHDPRPRDPRRHADRRHRRRAAHRRRRRHRRRDHRGRHGRRRRAPAELDADGALVTPGFVDIHTHYDGQATWDTRLPAVVVRTA